MTTTAFELREKLLAYWWYGVLGLFLIVVGMVLAVSIPLLAILLGLVGWILTLPYHNTISLYVAVATFNSALIFPFLGRPRVWELASLLAWSGIPLAIIFRRYAPDTRQLLKANKWIIIGLFIYCTVLLVLMKHYGIGFGALGSTVGGGRFYLQQILCAVFPLLFIMHRVEAATLVRLYQIQLLMSSTYLITELAFTLFPTKLGFLLYFFDTSIDMAGFLLQQLRFQIVRYQSLGIACPAIIYLLLIRYPIRDFFGRRAWWLLPVTTALFITSLLSGHRSVVLFPMAVILILAAVQGLFNARNLLIGGLAILTAIAFMYAAADRLPLAAQRAISFLPGLKINEEARYDAYLTWIFRRELLKIGWDLVPQYLWMGRGFNMDLNMVQFYSHPIEAAIDQGFFYNGVIGLLVTTGLPGTIGMLLFLLGGTILSFRILRLARQNGANDVLTRVNVLAAAQFLVNLVSFIFLHGNAQWAVKYFSLQTGIMIGAQRLLASQYASSLTRHATALPNTDQQTNAKLYAPSPAVPQAKPA